MAQQEVKLDFVPEEEASSAAASRTACVRWKQLLLLAAPHAVLQLYHMKSLPNAVLNASTRSGWLCC